jgi:hypothetical protein
MHEEMILKTLRYSFTCALLTCLLGLPALASADQIQGMKRNKFSLSPLPVDIYLRKGEKPTVAFTTPCIMIEKASHGFPPFMAFESFMFEVIGNVNESNLLPARLEPVCI